MPISFLLDADTAKLEQAMSRAKDVVSQQTSSMLSSVEAATSGMVRAFGESSAALDALASSGGGIGSLDQFEARLNSFGINIEGTAKNAQFAIGTLALGLRGFSAAEFTKAILDANKELSELARVSRLVGESTDNIQKFQYAMKTLGGVDAAQSLKTALDLYARANSEFNEVKAGGTGGNLTKLFDANGLSLKDANGDLKDFQSIMEDVSRLVTNARTEIDKIRIAQLLGVSQEWIAALEKGPLALREAQNAAKDAGAVIDQELVKKAAEFDTWWNNSWSNLTTKAKAAAAEIGQYLHDMILGASDVDKLGDQLSNLQRRRSNIISANGGDETYLDSAIAVTERQLAEAARDRLAKAMAGKAQQTPDTSERSVLDYKQVDDAGFSVGGLVQPGKTSGQFAKEQDQARQAQTLVVNRNPTGRPTVIPSTARDSGTESLDEVERYTKQLEKQVDVAEAQVKVMGLGNAERVKAVDLARAEAAARERGSDLTDAERQKIERLAQAHADATKALEDYKKAQRAVADATNFFGQQAIDVFDQMIFQGAKASDVFKSLAQTIVKAALQAELLGSGPLAGLFGTTGQNGNVGGLLGSLVKGGLFGGGSFSDPGGGSVFNPIAGARAGGGPVSAGQTYLVGEKGPELLRMASDGIVIPNAALGGSSGGMNVTVINQAGAQIETKQTNGPKGPGVEVYVTQAIMKDIDQRGPIARMLEKKGLRR